MGRDDCAFGTFHNKSVTLKAVSFRDFHGTMAAPHGTPKSRIQGSRIFSRLKRFHLERFQSSYYFLPCSHYFLIFYLPPVLKDYPIDSPAVVFLPPHVPVHPVRTSYHMLCHVHCASRTYILMFYYSLEQPVRTSCYFFSFFPLLSLFLFLLYSYPC